MPVTRDDERLWRDGQEALAENLQQLKRARAGCQGAICVLVNACQFAVLANYDLRQLLYDIKRAGDSWAGKLYARTLALTLYECTEDFTAIFGRPLRQASSELGGPDALAELGRLHSRAKTFFHAERPLLQGIRLQVIGHREHDAAVQIEQLESLNVTYIENLGYETVQWLTDFHVFTTSLWRGQVQAISKSL